MGWLHSLFSPLRRMWVRAHSERRNRKSSIHLCLWSPSYDRIRHSIFVMVLVHCRHFSSSFLEYFLPSLWTFFFWEFLSELSCIRWHGFSGAVSDAFLWQGGECTSCTRTCSPARTRTCRSCGRSSSTRTATRRSSSSSSETLEEQPAMACIYVWGQHHSLA